jgi:hypothetical protein
MQLKGLFWLFAQHPAEYLDLPSNTAVAEANFKEIAIPPSLYIQ